MGLYWQLHEHAQTKEKREIKNKKKTSKQIKYFWIVKALMKLNPLFLRA